MKMLLALLLCTSLAVDAQVARQRVAAATVYANWASGNDAWDGTAATYTGGTTGPVKTIQRAFDYACGNYDITPPWTWVDAGNTGERSGGVTVQLAPASSGAPYDLPKPAYLDGLGCGGQVTLRGDPANRSAYNLFCSNTLQGLTAQHGAKLIINGITIRGHQYCTLINVLESGNITIKDAACMTGYNGPGNCAGAAGGSTLTLDGKLTLLGAGGFNTIFSAIESSRIIFTPSANISLGSTMNYGIMFNMMYASAWTQGVPITWSGAGISTSTGSRYNAYFGALIGFCMSPVPGSGGNSDGISTVFSGC